MSVLSWRIFSRVCRSGGENKMAAVPPVLPNERVNDRGCYQRAAALLWSVPRAVWWSAPQDEKSSRDTSSQQVRAAAHLPATRCTHHNNSAYHRRGLEWAHGNDLDLEAWHRGMWRVTHKHAHTRSTPKRKKSKRRGSRYCRLIVILSKNSGKV